MHDFAGISMPLAVTEFSRSCLNYVFLGESGEAFSGSGGSELFAVQGEAFQQLVAGVNVQLPGA